MRLVATEAPAERVNFLYIGYEDSAQASTGFAALRLAKILPVSEASLEVAPAFGDLEQNRAELTLTEISQMVTKALG